MKQRLKKKLDVYQHIIILLWKKNLDSFDLSVDAGSFTESEIIVLLGENGTGKKIYRKINKYINILNLEFWNIFYF